MFIPKNFKFRKHQKGKNFNKILSKLTVQKPNCIKLKTTTFGRLTSNELKALKQNINKIIKKRGRVVFITFPQTAITKNQLKLEWVKVKELLTIGWLK